MRRSLSMLAAAAVLPVLAYAAFLLFQFNGALKGQAEDRLLGTAAIMAQGIERTLEEDLEKVAMLATSPHLRRGELEAFRDHATRVVATVPDWLAIAVFDAGTGEQVLNTAAAELPRGAAAVDRQSFERVLEEGRPAIGGVVTASPTLKGPFVVARSPVMGDGGQVRYVLTAARGSSAFSRILEGAGLPDTWTAAAIDPTLTIAGRTGSQEFVGQKVTPSLATAIEGSRSGVFVSDNKEGRPVYTVFRRLDGFDWTVALGIPADEVEAPARERLLGTFLVGLAIASASLAMTVRISSRIRRQAVSVERAHVEELRAMNAELDVARRDADAANLAKSRFLAAASHDLRQPFQSMRLFHHLLGGHVAGARGRDAHAGLGDALEAGEQLLTALLDVSTLEAGVVKPNVAATPLDAVLRSVVAELEPVARDGGLRLRSRIRPILVGTDPVLLGRLVRNLVLNAVRHAQSDVLIGCRLRGGKALVEVWDAGPGIPRDKIDAVFDDFVQLDNPERDRRKGLGLGLSIARRTASLLGHDLTVRSVEGRGTVFRIAIARTAGAMPAPQAPTPERRTGGLAVLLVEDEAGQRDALRQLLEDQGHAVRTAGSADAGLRVLAEWEPPDLIVSDLRLPGPMDGRAFILAARKELGREIPALIVTGDTAPERLKHLAGLGVRVLHKPYRPGDLLAAMAELACPVR